jgi:hypothetical protein
VTNRLRLILLRVDTCVRIVVDRVEAVERVEALVRLQILLDPVLENLNMGHETKNPNLGKFWRALEWKM